MSPDGVLGKAFQEGLLEEVRSELESDEGVGIRRVRLEACGRLMIRAEERWGQDRRLPYRDSESERWAELEKCRDRATACCLLYVTL